jgi:hypothetical protein
MVERFLQRSCTAAARPQPFRGGSTMPEKATLERARKDRREGKAPTTQAGEFVREEMDHIRRGKHGARSTKQAIAIGLSKARRAGVKLGPPPRGANPRTKRSAAAASRAGRRGRKRPNPRRSRAVERALKREGHRAASRRALSKQARSAARRRSPAARKQSARKAVRTKGPRERREAARRAARTRRRRARAHA